MAILNRETPEASRYFRCLFKNTHQREALIAPGPPVYDPTDEEEERETTGGRGKGERVGG